jgi:hypothetical protein
MSAPGDIQAKIAELEHEMARTRTYPDANFEMNSFQRLIRYVCIVYHP